MAMTEELRNINAAIQEEALHTAREWFKKCCYVPQTYYLYFRPGRIQFCVSAEHPGEGWELATNERISPAMTVEQAKWWISEIARNLPILPAESEAA